MKNPLCLGLLFGLAVRAGAQISVEVQFDQDQYLPGEAMTAKVRVGNSSGQTLTFGEAADWLVLNIESKDGYVVEKLSEAPVLGKFDLPSASRATKRLNLAPHFNLTRPGRYLISATVKVREWDREWTSKPGAVTVIRGTKLWEQDIGVPSVAGREPELRKYALLQADYLRQKTLYARVTDGRELKIFRVEPIGPMVSFSKPEAQVDRANRLHTLWQFGARSFQYVVLDPDGETTVRQTWEFGEGRPTLRLGEEGHIYVAGGVRRETRYDVPAPKIEEEPPRPAPVPE